MEQKFIKYMTKNKQIGGGEEYMIKCLKKIVVGLMFVR